MHSHAGAWEREVRVVLFKELTARSFIALIRDGGCAALLPPYVITRCVVTRKFAAPAGWISLRIHHQCTSRCTVLVGDSRRWWMRLSRSHAPAGERIG